MKKYPNRTTHSRIEILICIGEDNKLVNRKQQGVITFRHDDFEGTVIYCVRRWAKVLQEGATEHFFKSLDNAQSNGGTPEANSVREEGRAVEVVQEIFMLQFLPKILQWCATRDWMLTVITTPPLKISQLKSQLSVLDKSGDGVVHSIKSPQLLKIIDRRSLAFMV